jgi:hypothetical protein
MERSSNIQSKCVPRLVQDPKCSFRDLYPSGLANYSFYFEHMICPSRLERSREGVRRRHYDVAIGSESLLDGRYLFLVVLVFEIGDDYGPHQGHVDG